MVLNHSNMYAPLQCTGTFTSNNKKKREGTGFETRTSRMNASLLATALAA